ncbi:MAG: aldose 1-epimerase family protein [Clostridia bacterium]|nr:aldose 1-epimerase family protein [Clostridia bacterium]MBQ6614288.1 aldose 1-epimerase family protein [Clostridia bacterium]
MNKYIGHTSQIYGVEEHRLAGGRGDGMRLLQVRNGKGLEFTVSLDRAADISRLSLSGANFGYFAPCGYVSPKYYDNVGIGFLKSFTAGFFTTCGLTAVGSPCVDDGEETPLHGTVSNIPCETFGYWEKENKLHIKATVRDAALFSRQLLLEREYIVSLTDNEIVLKDTVKNIGSVESPLQILYHCNMGYPLLDENAKISIPSVSVAPRNEHAATDIDNCLVVEKPQNGYEEMCYFHEMHGDTVVSIFNSKIGKGLEMHYNADNLKYFTQWKMMGEYDYVMGLEPGNCLPDGRNVMREKGLLETLKPGEERMFEIKFKFTEE